MYRLAYVDPPWHYYGSKTKNAAAGKHYDLLTLDQLSFGQPVRGWTWRSG